MRTSAAALELDLTEPSITAAKAVACSIAQNGSLQRETLLWVIEQAYGGSSADGRWSLREAYDMLEFAALWQAEVEEMLGKTRTSTLYLVTGLLLPVWDRLPDDHVQVWRLNTYDGECFLGRSRKSIRE